MLAFATGEAVVVSADNRAVRQFSDHTGKVTGQESVTSEKIWLVRSRIVAASCGSSTMDVPGLMRDFTPMSITPAEVAEELLTAFSPGLVPGNPWVLYVAGLDSGVPTLLQVDVPEHRSVVISQGARLPHYRAWGEGMGVPASLPSDTQFWSVENVLEYSRDAIRAASHQHPEWIGPPVRSAVVTTRGAEWLAELTW